MTNKITILTLSMMLLSSGAYAQAVNPAVTAQTRAPSAAPSTTNAPAYMQQNAPNIPLVQAEQVVRQARGECRLQSQTANGEMSAEGRAERSAAYQTCMAGKRAGVQNTASTANPAAINR